ncbi:hypothetical protein BU24DRAFT_496549 [Aaosphaeria arxii CBS 175.79]|uniref:Zn(2)-C6 fungal-type domain-containing protein n=1 Tax=Aaosphaeria arxii CBS 175.79 TaxID=1450172 RepID=A0A6A5XC96_9PLEO|nr:uncharacterized protein BU24DRAFT_496549 [Aaosphaeria arxii CBS 175.79]KAF2010588.1 hypothetical protein BU24DRAFT_496549 [Aaosphaeria arxii CBS 175.79]
MVYRGRPSTGCLKCRKRKIKCDERPDGCVKCAEKGFDCPGYESQLDRLFQDESAHVERKAKAAKAKAIALRKQHDDQDRIDQRMAKREHAVELTIHMPLLGPLIDQGINFFMSNYAIGMNQPPLQSKSYHQHLDTFGFHPIIATSMTALGLAGISNICMDRNFKREATQWYLKALKMTNAALASPTLMKHDSTLLATMLLCMYEATSNKFTLAGWSSHVDGSALLLKIRGSGQFATPSGRWMYHQTVGLLTANCMGKGEPIPEYIMEMNQESEKHEDSKHPGNRFFHAHIEVINFRADISQGRLIDLEKIINRALELDAKTQDAFKDAESEWFYNEIPVERGIPGVFGSRYHIYTHMAAAQIWNWIRYIRIYLHDIIRNSIILGFSMSPPSLFGKKYTHILQETTQTLYNLQADILASIPQLLHDTPKSPLPYSRDLINLNTVESTPVTPRSKFLWSNFREQISSSYKYSTEATSTERLPIIRVSGGYTQLWAFFIAGTMPIATPEVQEFVIHSLSRIEMEFGISQAKVFSNALKLKIQMDKKGETPFQIVPTYLPMVGEHLEIFPMGET